MSGGLNLAVLDKEDIITLAPHEIASLRHLVRGSGSEGRHSIDYLLFIIGIPTKARKVIRCWWFCERGRFSYGIRYSLLGD